MNSFHLHLAFKCIFPIKVLWGDQSKPTARREDSESSQQGHVLTAVTAGVSTCTLEGKSGEDLAGKSVTAQFSAQQCKLT